MSEQNFEPEYVTQVRHSMEGSSFEVCNIDRIVGNEATLLLHASNGYYGSVEQATIVSSLEQTYCDEYLSLMLEVGLNYPITDAQWNSHVLGRLRDKSTPGYGQLTIERSLAPSTYLVSTPEQVSFMLWHDVTTKQVVLANDLHIYSDASFSEDFVGIGPRPLTYQSAEQLFSAFGRSTLSLLHILDNVHNKTIQPVHKTIRLGEDCTNPTAYHDTRLSPPRSNHPLALDKKRRKSTYLVESNTSNFDEIQGYEEIISELRDIATAVNNPAILKEYGVRSPSGIILYGRSGTGKTTMARGFANEIGAELWQVCSTDIMDKFVGQSALNARKLLVDIGRVKTPLVILLDEFDAILGGNGNASQERVDTIGVFKRMMRDLGESNPNAMFIATTNSMAGMDPALLSAGRFDVHIEVPLPSKDTLSKLFGSKLLEMVTGEKWLLAGSLELENELVEISFGTLSGNDVLNIFNRIKLSGAVSKIRTGCNRPIDALTVTTAVRRAVHDKNNID
ncbi:ATP-binding protein [Candidatus Saccharibacteria bacterium]|nr:ATP-binding protein [Candidatus Saccharibacteria bacterium]